MHVTIDNARQFDEDQFSVDYYVDITWSGFEPYIGQTWAFDVFDSSPWYPANQDPMTWVESLGNLSAKWATMAWGTTSPAYSEIVNTAAQVNGKTHRYYAENAYVYPYLFDMHGQHYHRPLLVDVTLDLPQMDAYMTKATLASVGTQSIGLFTDNAAHSPSHWLRPTATEPFCINESTAKTIYTNWCKNTNGVKGWAQSVAADGIASRQYYVNPEPIRGAPSVLKGTSNFDTFTVQKITAFFYDYEDDSLISELVLQDMSGSHLQPFEITMTLSQIPPNAGRYRIGNVAEDADGNDYLFWLDSIGSPLTPERIYGRNIEMPWKVYQGILDPGRFGGPFQII